MKKTKFELKEIIRKKEKNIEILLDRISNLEVTLDYCQHQLDDLKKHDHLVEELREVELNLAQEEGKVKKLSEENDVLSQELSMCYSQISTEMADRMAFNRTVVPFDKNLTEEADFPFVFEPSRIYSVTFDTAILNMARLQQSYTFGAKSEELSLVITGSKLTAYKEENDAIRFHLAPPEWQSCSRAAYFGFIEAFEDGPTMCGSSGFFVVPVDAINNVFECKIEEVDV